MRDPLRKEFGRLLREAVTIMATLDVRDKNGHIIETGYSIIERILSMQRSRKNINEAVKIIGKSKWLKLKEIQDRMRIIEEQDKKLLSK